MRRYISKQTPHVRLRRRTQLGYRMGRVGPMRVADAAPPASLASGLRWIGNGDGLAESKYGNHPRWPVGPNVMSCALGVSENQEFRKRPSLCSRVYGISTKIPRSPGPSLRRGCHRSRPGVRFLSSHQHLCRPRELAWNAGDDPYAGTWFRRIQLTPSFPEPKKW